MVCRSTSSRKVCSVNGEVVRAQASLVRPGRSVTAVPGPQLHMEVASILSQVPALSRQRSRLNNVLWGVVHSSHCTLHIVVVLLGLKYGLQQQTVQPGMSTASPANSQVPLPREPIRLQCPLLASRVEQRPAVLQGRPAQRDATHPWLSITCAIVRAGAFPPPLIPAKHAPNGAHSYHEVGP
ncbi:hypothetical protein N656DRAFT_199480 [Canariomyces notabilis]|uniref:Uncharacterized protein n=1 Tax=Canariomyces notabilis TaxID=2074819 RepID=A0AAN6TB02_9PEZI|nr:hypothetical protein N656DRAFT_199480 [Canariomyces arenarius]